VADPFAKDWPWSSFCFYSKFIHGLIRVDPIAGDVDKRGKKSDSPSSANPRRVSQPAVVPVAQPIQYCVSIWGCRDWGPSERKVPFFAASRARVSRSSCSLRYPRTEISETTTAIKRPIRLFTRIFSHRVNETHEHRRRVCPGSHNAALARHNGMVRESLMDLAFRNQGR
jgi:hypothetical protein